MIDWKPPQKRLNVPQDGNAGPVTYAAFIARVAGHAVPNAREIGIGIAAHITAYEIDTNVNRLCSFIGETCEESNGFIDMQERGGDTYFTRLYEGRADLGNTQPGDGPRFHGRGLIQLTGRANYRTYGTALGLDLIANPDQAAEPSKAVLIAMEYWKRKGLNALADVRDEMGICKRINGGLNGYSERVMFVDRARGILI